MDKERQKKVKKQSKKLIIYHIVHCTLYAANPNGGGTINKRYSFWMLCKALSAMKKQQKKDKERNEMQNIHIKEMNACYFRKSHQL